VYIKSPDDFVRAFSFSGRWQLAVVRPEKEKNHRERSKQGF